MRKHLIYLSKKQVKMVNTMGAGVADTSSRSRSAVKDHMNKTKSVYNSLIEDLDQMKDLDISNIDKLNLQIEEMFSLTSGLFDSGINFKLEDLEQLNAINVAISRKFERKTRKLKSAKVKRLRQKLMMTMGMLEDMQQLRRTEGAQSIQDHSSHTHSNLEAVELEDGIIKIQCMDFRLSLGGFRNAGGNLVDFSDYLIKLLKEDEEHQIKGIEVTGHRDCGGLKTVMARLNGDTLGLDEDTLREFDKFVAYFKDRGLEGASIDALKGSVGKTDEERVENQRIAQERLTKIEDSYVAVQEEILKDILKKAGRNDIQVIPDISVRMGGVPDAPENAHTGKVLVAVGNPSLQNATEPLSSYVICVPEPSLARTSAIIAKVVMEKDPKDFTVVTDERAKQNEVTQLKAEIGIPTVKHGARLHSGA